MHTIAHALLDSMALHDGHDEAHDDDDVNDAVDDDVDEDNADDDVARLRRPRQRDCDARASEIVTSAPARL